MLTEKRSLYMKGLEGRIPEIRVTVGVHDEEGSKEHRDSASWDGDELVQKGSGLTVAEIGEIHEFGLGVPRRSFIRDWFDQQTPQIKADIEKELRSLPTRSPAIIAERLALRMQGRVQVRMTTPGTFKPNAQSTIDAKGSSMPLIHHGILKAAILGHGEVRP